jgi:hypothetical protein
MSFRINLSGPLARQVNINTLSIADLLGTTDDHTSAIAVNQQFYTTAPSRQSLNPNLSGGDLNTFDSIYNTLAEAGLIEAITPDRTITFNNMTTSTNLDLYLTVGGSHPQPITGIATLTAGGAPYVWPISNTGYNWNGNFTTMPAGVPPPQYNAGPTIAEFGLNQVWKGSTPEMRDTFDISTVPAGIGTDLNNGPRSAVVAKSQAAGFSVQQSYNYNVGIQIIPPNLGPLGTQTVSCTDTDGDCAQSIGYPNDTAFPKQQTGGATGNYIVNFIDPVVSL